MNTKQLQRVLKEKEVDYAFLFNFGEHPDPNFSYLAGYAGWGVLVVPQKGKAKLLVPKMEAERASSSPHTVVVVKKRLSEELSGFVEKMKTYGIDEKSITLDIFKGIKKALKGKYVDIGDDIRQLRAVKTDAEVKKLKKACSISDDILERCFKQFGTFTTERDVEIFLKEQTLKAGCGLAFPPIVASGKGAAQPHYEPKDIKLRKGFCVIDFGVVYDGYHSDTTRTLYLGTPSKKEKELYERVLKAQEKTVESLLPGVRCGEVWDVCMEQLGELKEQMPHGLGHGVGVEIHELPNLKPGSEDTLQKNQVLTIEPGVYKEGEYGIRIEDTVLITKKPIILTTLPKTLKVIAR